MRNIFSTAKKVVLPTNADRTMEKSNQAANRTGDILSDHKNKFTDLRYLINIGLVNYSIKIDSKRIYTLITD